MIVVAGEALIDVVDGRERAGGGPFNTARALARLSVPVAFLGRLSTDARGQSLAGLLERDGVRLHLASTGPEPTTVARARIGAGGVAAYTFDVAGTSAPNLLPAAIPADLGRVVEAVHAGSLGLVLEPMASTLMGLIERERGRRVVMLDPNVRPGLVDDAGYRERLRRAIAMSDVVKASDSDAAWIFGTDDHEAAADAMLEAGALLAVITLGARGAYARYGSSRVHLAAPPVEVVDTIGAGDTFGAALAAWMHDHDALHTGFTLTEKDLRAALDYACLAASLTCARAGADPPTRAEVLAASARGGARQR